LGWHGLDPGPVEATSYESARRKNEEAYRETFRDVPEIVLPPGSVGVLSHFSVLIPAELRDRAQAKLWRRGVDSGTQYVFPPYLDPAAFPQSLRASQFILNIPMGNKIPPDTIRWIAEQLKTSLQ
jgi:dTDP-4-amino-4,6-dideoxygalactose transaminase